MRAYHLNGGGVLAKVVELNLKERKEGPRKSVPEAVFVSAEGVKGDDLHRGSEHSASLLARETQERIAALGIDGLCTRRFYANIVTEGINLFDLPVGTCVQIGGARFAIKQIGKPCWKDCAIYESSHDCALHQEAIFADILTGGTVHVGDEIIVEAEL